MQRLPILLGIRSDRTPRILATLPGVTLIEHELPGGEVRDDVPTDPGCYWLLLARNGHVAKVNVRRALPHDEALPDTASSVQLGLPAGAPSAAPSGRWGIWWLVVEWVDESTQHVRAAATWIYRALNRLARSPLNVAVGGGYHITVPWTRRQAATQWAPAAVGAVLSDGAGNPRQAMLWDGDPLPDVQALWDYAPSAAECDADEDLDETALEAVYGGGA